MSHARIEEVSDSDDGGSDPSEGDIDDLDDDFDERDILKQRSAPAPRPSPATAKASQIKPSSIPSSGNVPIQNQIGVDDARYQKYKDFQCIYPVYFDKNRSRGEGRRVGTKGAVENPLALEIVNACQRMGLETLFEPTKIHPKDWANPGRVKVKVKGGNKLGIKHSSSTKRLDTSRLLILDQNTTCILSFQNIFSQTLALLRQPKASTPQDLRCQMLRNHILRLQYQRAGRSAVSYLRTAQHYRVVESVMIS